MTIKQYIDNHALLTLDSIQSVAQPVFMPTELLAGSPLSDNTQIYVSGDRKDWVCLNLSQGTFTLISDSTRKVSGKIALDHPGLK